jgi:hypothetical protein
MMILNGDDDFYEESEFEPSDMDEEDWDGSRLEFQDPGGNSALRAASPTNPRNLPCPTCGRKNMLTPKDVALHYQCDYCADAAEGIGFGGEY